VTDEGIGDTANIFEHPRRQYFRAVQGGQIGTVEQPPRPRTDKPHIAEPSLRPLGGQPETPPKAAHVDPQEIRRHDSIYPLLLTALQRQETWRT
jgi:hypothetical protein